jgi:hypothetical protein
MIKPFISEKIMNKQNTHLATIQHFNHTNKETFQMLAEIKI